MGVYIDMEMPKGLEMLVVFSDGKVYKCLPSMRGHIEKGAAVPVPPHGDLIDRPKLVDSFSPSDFWNPSAEDNCFAAIHVVNSMPTIIPEEGR